MTKQEQVMELWRQNFHDSEEFIQFYFERKFSNENSLVYEENGKALSALLMLPYPMTWQKNIISTSYISGACTQKEVRNQGFMTLLLKEAFAEMYKKGVGLSTLIPAEEWLFKYYGNLGYVPVFDYSTEQFKTESEVPEKLDETICPDHFDLQLTKYSFSYFEQKMLKRPCCIQHPWEDYKAIIEEIYLCGGRLAVIPNAPAPQGWAIAVPDNGTIKIKEIFYDSPVIKKALLQAFSAAFQLTAIECKVPPRNHTAQSYGMARIIHVHQMLQYFAEQHPSQKLSVKVRDPQLLMNQGSYFISEGKCIKEDASDNHTDIETDIPTLTKALMGYHPEQLPPDVSEITEIQFPYMNLMLD